MSRFTVSPRKALSVQVKILNATSWSDSKVTLYWVKSVTKKWNIWVENFVSEIRGNIGVVGWRYGPTDCNSKDVVTRYNKKTKFKEVFWRKDSSFLCKAEKVWPKSDFSSDCRNNADLNQEMREVLVAPV